MHVCPEPRACTKAFHTVQVPTPAGTRGSTAVMAAPVTVV